jgi:Uma2 family endonuclease
MARSAVDDGLVRVDEFYAFTDTRPDEERWELIGGRLVLKGRPNFLHQSILGNIICTVGIQERERDVPWFVIPGIGIRLSDADRPQPDAMILSDNFVSRDPQRRDSESAVVLFEIMSSESADRDLGWKRSAYTGLVSLTHDVAIKEDAVDVAVFARADGFAEHRLKAIEAAVDFPSLGVTLPLSEIYRDTGLA